MCFFRNVFSFRARKALGKSDILDSLCGKYKGSQQTRLPKSPKLTGKSHSSVGWLYLCHSRFYGFCFHKFRWTHLPMWWTHCPKSLKLFASVLTHCLSPCLHWQAKQVVPSLPFFFPASCVPKDIYQRSLHFLFSRLNNPTSFNLSF